MLTEVLFLLHIIFAVCYCRRPSYPAPALHHPCTPLLYPTPFSYDLKMFPSSFLLRFGGLSCGLVYCFSETESFCVGLAVLELTEMPLHLPPEWELRGIHSHAQLPLRPLWAGSCEVSPQYSLSSESSVDADANINIHHSSVVAGVAAGKRGLQNTMAIVT